MYRLDLQPHVRIGDICSWIEWDCRQCKPGARHGHRFREMMWILEGKGVHWVSQQQRELLPRTLVLVHEDDFHTVTAAAEDHVRFVNLAFGLDVWEAMQARYDGHMDDPFGGDLDQRTVTLSETQWEELLWSASELGQGNRGRFALDRFLMNLLFLLHQPNEPAPDGKPLWLGRAALRLRDTEVVHGGVQAFVRCCGRSREHVARACRQYMAKTPTELVNDARLELAALAIAQTDRRIIDVAMAHGFGHIGHFYRQFERRYGMTPRKYRIHHQAMIRRR